MKIFLKPQVRDNEYIIYEFSENIITATHNGISDSFDFTGFGDGELQVKDEETGENLIDTIIENPIWSAKKIDGVLFIELMNYISIDATEAESFPDWIDHSEYTPPKAGEVNGQDEMEE